MLAKACLIALDKCFWLLCCGTKWGSLRFAAEALLDWLAAPRGSRVWYCWF